MLLTIAGILLIGWVVGVSFFDVGKGIHVFLLVGLMLLLLGLLKARDAALSARGPSGPPEQK